METFTFDGHEDNLQQALDIHATGGKVLCPKCGAELIIVSNRAEAKKTGISPGIVCSANKKHMERAFILKEDFLAFDRLCKEMEEKRKLKDNL
ncbi:MAG: hypothetical protein ACRC2R_02340 [Xenococcaceae cyanobacterium]